ncbi:MAG TPA: alpha-amylase family glycosyl hydrolase, partial [Solirubrobacteraceae bacterium]|nr:alpha-amylase family glycosyl hydrolase [Solirubrobacteraceae bacterium]
IDVSARAPFEPPAVGDLVIYELHVGTFSEQGTFDGAIPYLRELASLGVNAIEIMPVAEFPGTRGWGYDGVYISAAQSSYGGPHGLQRLVAAAHRAGLAVILDVVYNHVGASGVTALEAFGPYFTSKHETPWGRAINYDDDGSEGVREWVLQSAEGWVRDFGIDGLRLDAIHSIYDSSPEHIVAAVARRVRAARDGAFVIGELGLEDPGSYGAPACDALWRDQFHHALHVLLTGERDGYYESFGRVADLADALRFAPPERVVVFAQNHDQVGNRAFGDRLAPEHRPLAAFCTLLSPFVPLLFMGEEYGESAPFQFFSDHIDPKIAEATREGRRREFASFARFAEEIPDPQALSTFEHSKLTRRRDPELSQLYARLLDRRRRLPASAVEVSFDEHDGWLVARRGEFDVVCNFTTRPVSVEVDGGEVELATHAGIRVSDGSVTLPPLAGALIR